MKKLTVILFSVVLLGAGCAGLTGTKKGAGPDGGVFKSSDAGTTWTQVAAVPTAQGMGTLATTDVLNLEMDPSDRFVLYAGSRTSGFVSTQDGAMSWQLPRQAIFREGLIYAVEVDPNASCTYFVAKGNRLYKTSDCGRSFSDEAYVETRAGITILQVAVDWYNKGTVWIGLSNGDVLKSTDAGASWRASLKLGEEISEIMLNNRDSRQVMISSYKGGIWRTIDGGERWEKADGSISKLTGSSRVFALSQTADGSVLLAATQYGLLRSKDFGATWEAITLLTSPNQVTIRAAALAPEAPHVMYYATPGTFYRTNDGGVTWQTQKFPSARVPRAIVIDPKDEAVLYIGVAQPQD
ncbi:hypothetical protein FJZ23_01050 [Candidatus Parcubacteria bacterium]|nr:hypothetical protein [Candidatus Parcubacteria bacterium]